VQDCARYDFLEFELDLAVVELRKRGVPVALRPRSLEALVSLVRHRERVVSQQELFSALWPDVTVGQGSLRQAIWEIRQVLADAAGEERVIKTSRGRGYRFIAPVRERAAVARAARASAQPAGFFGRRHELSQLKGALEAGSQVAGRACLVVGTAGVGKSRLAREIILWAQEQRLEVAEAHADPDGAAPALWPWLQLLTSCLARVSPERRAACEQLAPAVFRILEQPALGAGCADACAWELDADSPGQQRFRLIDALGRLFRELLSDTPRLLVLDDLQWADEPSLAFLAHFAQVLPQTRALLVVAARAVPRGENRPLARALSVLMRAPLNQRIDLANLAVEDITRMLEAHTQDQIPASLALAVHALSQGNPLFALELSRLLSGTCAEERERVLHEQTEAHTIIRRRLERLPESGFEAVLAASILAPEFGLAELSGVLDEAPSAPHLRCGQNIRAIMRPTTHEAQRSDSHYETA
jgi:DNA-binding winged helix-turn-helix (wHTH) protein